MSAKTKTAIFIDGYNFQKLSYDAFGVRVDFAKLARHLAGDNFLVRTYYYTGEFNDESIEQFVRLSSGGSNPEQQRMMMQKRKSSQNRFLRLPRFLHPNCPFISITIWRRHRPLPWIIPLLLPFWFRPYQVAAVRHRLTV